MNSNLGTLTTLYVICGLALAAVLTTGIGAAIIRLECGTGGRPTSIAAGLQWAIGGNPAGYIYPVGCTPSVISVRCRLVCGKRNNNWPRPTREFFDLATSTLN